MAIVVQILNERNKKVIRAPGCARVVYQCAHTTLYAAYRPVAHEACFTPRALSRSALIWFTTFHSSAVSSTVDSGRVVLRRETVSPSILISAQPASLQKLLRRHLERIPVVEIDGIVASELVYDDAGVRARLDTVGAWPT